MNHSTTTTLMIAALLAAGCAAQPETADQEPPTVEEILAGAPQPEDYSDSVNCVHREAYVRVEVVNQELLLFHGRGDKVWLNRLRRPCLGLRRNDALAFDMRESRLCDLDTFSGIDTFGGPMERTSARCSLGEFETISPEQAALIMEQLSP